MRSLLVYQVLYFFYCGRLLEMHRQTLSQPDIHLTFWVIMVFNAEQSN